MPITPGSAEDSGLDQLFKDLRRLREGGGEGVLLREPKLSDRACLELARYARELFRDGWLGVHDRPHVALACGADAVHLGFRSLPPSSVRALAAGRLSVGHSHHLAELSALEMDADYRLIGPVHPTPSKAGLVEPLGLEALSRVSMASQTWAVGGIGPRQAREVLEAGVAGVACIGSVFGVEDPGLGIEQMLEAASSSAETT